MEIGQDSKPPSKRFSFGDVLFLFPFAGWNFSICPWVRKNVLICAKQTTYLMHCKKNSETKIAGDLETTGSQIQFPAPMNRLHLARWSLVMQRSILFGPTRPNHFHCCEHKSVQTKSVQI
jgi:hypothetical protein